MKGTVTIILVLVFRKILGRWLSPSGKVLLWLAAIISLTVPISIESNWAIYSNPPLSEVYFSELNTPLKTIHSEAATSSSVTGVKLIVPSQRIGILETIWAIGVAIFLFILLLVQFKYLRINRLAKDAGPRIQLLADSCLDSLNYHRTIRILETHNVTSPCIQGVFRPVLLFPTGLESKLTDEALRHVILHEIVHIKHHDILLNWAMSLTLALHWFNPVIWLAFRQMKADQELACDAKVLDSLTKDQHQLYGNTLVALTAKFPSSPKYSLVTGTSSGIANDHLQLKRRLEMIKQHKNAKSTHGALALTLFLGLTIAACTSTDTQNATNSSIDASAEKIIQNLSVQGIHNKEGFFLALGKALQADQELENSILRDLGIAMTDAEFAMSAQAKPNRPAFHGQEEWTTEILDEWASDVLLSWRKLRPKEAFTWIYATRNSYGYKLPRQSLMRAMRDWAYLNQELAEQHALLLSNLQLRSEAIAGIVEKEYFEGDMSQEDEELTNRLLLEISDDSLKDQLARVLERRNSPTWSDIGGRISALQSRLEELENPTDSSEDLTPKERSQYLVRIKYTLEEMQKLKNQFDQSK